MAEGTCSVAGCDRRYHSRGYCDAHYRRWRSTGDAGSVPIRVVTQYRGGRANWRGDRVTYSGLHVRLRDQRGGASGHPCQTCGKPAQDWAYDHSDPDELRDPGTGSPYSTDLERYVPLCHACHIRFDRSATIPMPPGEGRLIRAWANNNGWHVSPRGRIPQSAINAYLRNKKAV
jgi:hypothetical protein